MKIICVFLDVNMSLSFDGLNHLMKQNQVKPDVSENEFVVFVNRARTKAKIYASYQQIIIYLKAIKGKIDLTTIQYIPRVFSKKKFTYDDLVLEKFKSEISQPKQEK